MTYRNARISMLVAGLLSLAAALTACAKTTASDGVGTNTNWLRSCQADADCGDADSCICSVCTRACSSSAQCGALPDGASCEPLPGELCGTEPVRSACVQGCGSDADCAALPSGHCTAGVCVGQAATASPDAGDAGGGGDGGGSLVLTRNGATVEIGAGYTACAQDADCALVSTSCDQCCDFGAVTTTLQSTYATSFEQACTGYAGPECTCATPDLVARCDAGACVVVTRDQVTDCFSPTQNTERAYEPGAIGCACNAGDPDACVPLGALSCTQDQGTGAFAWIALADGVCGPRSSDCATSGTVFQTAAECMALGADCFHLPSGEYCAEACVEALDCGASPCPSYTALTPDDCNAMGNQPVGEGVCGNVRWRSTSGSFASSTEYWDAASGTLLAQSVDSDTPAACGSHSFTTISGDLSVALKCVRTMATPVCGEQP